MVSQDVSPADVLELWFSERVRPLHWKKDPAFDDELRGRFLGTYEAACAGELPEWERGPDEMLALIIVLDQFARNMFRGDARTHAADGLALRHTNTALALGWDRAHEPARRAFMYMTLMHSENPVDQRRCVELMAASGLDSNVKFAYMHKIIIDRFGRFPHRNELLGRISTPEERSYLAYAGGF
jgi:uncharacterized protein (DUF924 family)